MSYQKESFGMMDEGYFVPRTEILDWLNNLLNVYHTLNLAQPHQNIAAGIRSCLLPSYRCDPSRQGRHQQSELESQE